MPNAKHLKRIAKWLPLVFVLLLPVLYAAGEWSYAQSVVPAGVTTIDDHLQRFGEPEFVVTVRQINDPTTYFEFRGFPDGRKPVFALPSGHPAYVYDNRGSLVDWCGDTGDDNEWREKWKPTAEQSGDVKQVLNELLKGAS